jgi:DNA primase
VPFDVRSYLDGKLEDMHVSASGEINATCPFCGRKAGFYVSVKTGAFICFKNSCDVRGRNPIALIAKLEGISHFDASRVWMQSSVEFKRREETQESLIERIQALRGIEPTEESSVDYELPKEFKPVFDNGKWRYPCYLKERGIARETARAWGMGYCQRGRYGGRVVIPIECPNGKSFTARDATGEQEPRYLNPKGADHGRLLVGWQHVKIEGDIAIVEGPMDAIKMWQHGLPALALGGKVLHAPQLLMLLRKPQDAAITVLLDPDQPTAPYAVAQQLTCRFERVYVAHLPEGIDPGASTAKQARQALDGAERYTGDRIPRLIASIASSRRAIEK